MIEIKWKNYFNTTIYFYC